MDRSAEMDFVGDVRPVQTRKLRRPPQQSLQRTVLIAVSASDVKQNNAPAAEYYECFDTHITGATRCAATSCELAAISDAVKRKLNGQSEVGAITLVTSSSTHAQQTNTSFSEYHA